MGKEIATLWDESGDWGSRPGDGTFETGRLLLGKYRIGRLLGRGGMGSVYRATNERIRREFAIKVINAEVLDDISIARFRREAEAIAAVRHPNVVDIIDWETLPDGRPLLVMEYVEGHSLKSRLVDGPMSFAEIHDVAGQLLDGLAAAHAVGITHRDLKPDNLMLSRLAGGTEVVKILDFGLARVEKSSTLTESRDSLIGTPSYMSPEQIDGRTHEIGPGTDMWAVGAVLYEMTTGRKAFRGDNITSTLLRVMESTPAPISQLRPDAPPRLIRLIDRLLARDENRLSSAVSARQLLDDALADDPTRTASDLSYVLGSFQQPPRRKRRALRAVGLVVGALVGIGLGAAGFLFSSGYDGAPSFDTAPRLREEPAQDERVRASFDTAPRLREEPAQDARVKAEPRKKTARKRRGGKRKSGKSEKTANEKTESESTESESTESESTREFGDPLNPYR